MSDESGVSPPVGAAARRTCRRGASDVSGVSRPTSDTTRRTCRARRARRAPRRVGRVERVAPDERRGASDVSRHVSLRRVGKWFSPYFMCRDVSHRV